MKKAIEAVSVLLVITGSLWLNVVCYLCAAIYLDALLYIVFSMFAMFFFVGICVYERKRYVLITGCLLLCLIVLTTIGLSYYGAFHVISPLALMVVGVIGVSFCSERKRYVFAMSCLPAILLTMLFCLIGLADMSSGIPVYWVSEFKALITVGFIICTFFTLRMFVVLRKREEKGSKKRKVTV